VLLAGIQELITHKKGEGQHLCCEPSLFDNIHCVLSRDHSEPVFVLDDGEKIFFSNHGQLSFERRAFFSLGLKEQVLRDLLRIRLTKHPCAEVILFALEKYCTIKIFYVQLLCLITRG
jgi:hypothetical protein